MVGYPRLSVYRDRVDQMLPAGLTLDCYLRRIWTRLDEVEARVFIDGRLIEKAEWGTWYVNPGQVVTAQMIPTGGNDGGKTVLRIVAMIGIVILAAYTGGAALSALGPGGGGFLGIAGGMTAQMAGMYAAGISAAITIGGSLAISALIPPSRPRLGDLSDLTGSPALSLTGSSNAFLPYAPIPRVYGAHRIYPPLAARTFTEVVGSDQYLRMLFCLGYGPLEVPEADMRIGETPLSQFSDVTMQIQYGYPDDQNLTLFPDDIYEEPLAILLTATFIQITSQPNAKELSVDVTFPAGVGEQRGPGEFFPWALDIWVEFRAVGAGSWTTLTSIGTAASTQTNFTGANNDLVFTAATIGAAGNTFGVVFSAGGPSVPTVSFYTAGWYNIPPTIGRILNVSLNSGVTTSAQVKTAIEAIPVPQGGGRILVTHAAGNSGAGAITLPPGSGSNFYYTPSVSVQLTGGIDTVGSFRVSGPQRTQVRVSRRWATPAPNSYEVRVRIVPVGTPHSDRVYVLETAYWTMLRTIQTAVPINKTGLCFVALRIRATGQLSGQIDQFNCIARSILPDWNGTVWEPRVTDNPASIYLNVLHGTANRRPKTDAQIHLASIQAFHTHCQTNGFTFNAVVDFKTTVKQFRQDVLAVGRGTFHLIDMKYGVLFETVQNVGVAVITPRTSSGFTWSKRFLEIPHALRVRYVDAASDYRQNVEMVYSSGYTALTATIFEESEAGIGVTDRLQVQKLKLRELAEARLRPDEYSVTMDFEHLQFSRGDRVELQHDSVLFALASARVLARLVDGGGLITQLTIDEPVVMETGKEYGVRVWMQAGGTCVGKATTVVGTQTVLTFAVAIPSSSAVAIGDLLTFGLFGVESVACIVKHIQPGQDYSATVTLVDYAPAIMTADTIALPPYNGNVTSPQQNQRIISPPIIDFIQSDEGVLIEHSDGSLQSRILINVTFASGFFRPVETLQAQFRLSDTENDWIQVGQAVDGTTTMISLTPVEDGLTYDVRLRAVSRFGDTSDWVEVKNHTVIGRSTPPPDVTLVVIEGDRLRWNYANPPRDLAGFLVRTRSGGAQIWEDATPAHDNIILTTDFVIFRGLGLTTFLVKAVDMAGNESLIPGAVTVNYGDALISNIVLSTNHRTLGWPGTKTNGSVVTSQLQADASSPFWTVNGAPFWSGFDAAPFWATSFLEMTYDFTVTPATEVLDATLKLTATILGDWTIQYRSDSSALMWSTDTTILMWNTNTAMLLWSAKGPYTQWPGQLAPLSHQDYDIRIVTKSGLVQGILDQLSVILDVPDLFEYFNDQVIVSGGTRLPITKIFRSILAVRLDLQDNGGTAAYVKVMDKSVILHPLIQAFDSSNVTTGALVDAVVQGY